MQNPSQTRFYEIDCLRFVAAIAVMLYHYAVFGITKGYTSTSFPELAWIAKYGYMGVDLFFIISGYVILLSAQGKTPAAFCAARFTRLYPTFWFCMSLSFAATLLAGTPFFSVSWQQYLFNLTMFPEQLGSEPIDGVYWTLFAELRFYFWIFLIIFLRQQKHLQSILVVWLSICLANTPLDSKVLKILFVTEWSPYFIAGCIFFIKKQQGSLSQVMKGSLVLCTALCIYLALTRAAEVALMRQLVLFPAVTVMVTLLFFALFFLISIQKKAVLHHRLFYTMGVLTYPAYLLHQKLGYIFFNTYNDILNRWIMLAIAVTGILLLSWLVHIAIERPLSAPLNRTLRNILSKITGLAGR